MTGIEILELLTLAGVALIASVIAAVTGTGGGVVLLPVLVAVIGVRDAVPAYAIAQFLGNLSRIGLNRKEIRLPVVGWFTLGAIPLAIAGAVLFAKTPEGLLTRLLGAFLLGCVIWRHTRKKKRRSFTTWRFTMIGGAFAFVSALVGSAGPFLAPFFLEYGLLRGAYIGTEALSTAIMHVTKLTTYAAGDVLSAHAIRTGVLLGPIMVLGSFIGKGVMDRLSERAFVIIIEVVLLVFGLFLLIKG